MDTLSVKTVFGKIRLPRPPRSNTREHGRGAPVYAVFLFKRHFKLSVCLLNFTQQVGRGVVGALLNREKSGVGLFAICGSMFHVILRLFAAGQ